MKTFAKVFPRSANKLACQLKAAEFVKQAKLVPPPEGELLGIFVMCACCILEQVVAPSERKRRIIAKDLALLEPPVIAALYSATLWTLVAMVISQEKETEGDWIVACSALAGELEWSSAFKEGIWGGLEVGAFPALALHSRYKEILQCDDGVDGGFILLQIQLLAAYRTAIQDYYEKP
jgi:hypothetical protein